MRIAARTHATNSARLTASPISPKSANVSIRKLWAWATASVLLLYRVWAVSKPPAPAPARRACSPTLSPSLQYSGRLLPSAAIRPGLLPGCVAFALVSVCHTCEISPVSPREEAAMPATAATGTSATSTTRAVPIRRRTGSGSSSRSVA